MNHVALIDQHARDAAGNGRADRITAPRLQRANAEQRALQGNFAGTGCRHLDGSKRPWLATVAEADEKEDNQCAQ